MSALFQGQFPPTPPTNTPSPAEEHRDLTKNGQAMSLLSEAPSTPPPIPAYTPLLTQEDLPRLISQIAHRHGIPIPLAMAVVKVESDFRTDALSPKGAMGLMQLMPSTARELGVEDPFDPGENLEGGLRYLKTLLKRFDGDVRLALAAYNAGPGAVERWGGVPPYRETQRYVEEVLRYAGSLMMASSEDMVHQNIAHQRAIPSDTPEHATSRGMKSGEGPLSAHPPMATYPSPAAEEASKVDLKEAIVKALIQKGPITELLNKSFEERGSSPRTKIKLDYKGDPLPTFRQPPNRGPSSPSVVRPPSMTAPPLAVSRRDRFEGAFRRLAPPTDQTVEIPGIIRGKERAPARMATDPHSHGPSEPVLKDPTHPHLPPLGDLPDGPTPEETLKGMETKIPQGVPGPSQQALPTQPVQEGNPTPPAPSPSLTEELAREIVSQVVEKVKVEVGRGLQKMDLQLKPDFLGGIRIEVVLSKEAMTVHISAQTEEAKRLLETHLVEIQRGLENQGFRVDGLQVSLLAQGENGRRASWERPSERRREQEGRRYRPLPDEEEGGQTFEIRV